MATEKWLIDANELVKKMRTEDILHPTVPWSTSAVEVLCKRLCLDAVEVVRCGKCKWYDPDSEYCQFWHGVRHPGHYCGEGEGVKHV